MYSNIDCILNLESKNYCHAWKIIFENESPFPFQFKLLRKIAKWNWEPSCNGTRLYNWKYQKPN